MATQHASDVLQTELSESLTLADVEAGAFVKWARQQRKLSVEELAALTGIAVPSLLRFENGIRAMRSLDTITDLADALHLSRKLLAVMVLTDCEKGRGGWE